MGGLNGASSAAVNGAVNAAVCCREQAFASPGALRETLSTTLARLPTPPPRPDVPASARVINVTNWASIFKPWPLEGCKQLVQYPIRNLQVPRYVIIFRPTADSFGIATTPDLVDELMDAPPSRQRAYINADDVMVM